MCVCVNGLINVALDLALCGALKDKTSDPGCRCDWRNVDIVLWFKHLAGNLVLFMSRVALTSSYGKLWPSFSVCSVLCPCETSRFALSFRSFSR
ncbi:hypothetical protein ElyMa_003559900 [Elysia marginata]|uniref:Secreted protein n=1 Tax=Elysia marginata TaxID=1093978 RepID=A0AAV4EKP9_9GAST|nr:hypothetical protein ElyMa_003559900 [Elysia marginata]